MRWLVRVLAPRDRRDEALGDLAEARSMREALELVIALLRVRLDLFGSYRGSGSLHDYRLALRMLLKYPGLTVAGGLALAIAIGLGAAWYDVTNQIFHPVLPLPDSNRIATIEVINLATGREESRLTNDVAGWPRDAKTFEVIGGYRTLRRNLAPTGGAAEIAIVAETTASTFSVARATPTLGRPLVEADEQPGAPTIVVLGYGVWQRQFAGRTDIIGQTVLLGTQPATVVGVMPRGFRFPVNHDAWIPLERASDPPRQSAKNSAVLLFGRLAPGVTMQQANAEIATLVERANAARTGEPARIRSRVGPYGAASVDQRWIAFFLTHLPILLVLTVACANVGTVVYARTATRDGEITMRYALGASRGRIVTQLFIEALGLALVGAVVGLTAANAALKWAFDVFTSGQPDALPFWISPGLRFSTVIFTALLAIVGAAMLGILPALKATGSNAQTQLRNLGSGGATLRFGKGWTALMIGQVAVTVICLPFVLEYVYETTRNYRIRQHYPADRYLAVHLSSETDAPLAELERRIAQEPGVVAVTFAVALPGIYYDARPAEIEVAPDASVQAPLVWRNAVGTGFFETFDVALVAGRGFHDGDRTAAARTVIVNEAFSRRFLSGANPVGRRLRYIAADATTPEAWLEIVGMVRDIGMSPTGRGEAPYVFHPASPGTMDPLRIGVRLAGDPAAFIPKVRAIASDVHRGIRLDSVQRLDDLIRSEDKPGIVIAGATIGVVALAAFLSAFGIFSLMSVSVARRTREIGLRSALGASPSRMVIHIFRHALLIVGGGVGAGVAGILLFAVFYVTQVEPIKLSAVVKAVVLTSSLMFVVGLLACVEPIRRALRIQPADALKEF
jgi:putative ABC transport system permease protein